jgi:hypothetical protein
MLIVEVGIIERDGLWLDVAWWSLLVTIIIADVQVYTKAFGDAFDAVVLIFYLKTVVFDVGS